MRCYICAHTWLTPWMIVLGLELAVVLELERRGCPSEGSPGPSPLGGPSKPEPSLKSWNSTSLGSPSAAWVGGSKPKTSWLTVIRRWMVLIHSMCVIEQKLTCCVSLDVTLDHLTHKVSKRGVGWAGIIIGLTVTTTAKKKKHTI